MMRLRPARVRTYRIVPCLLPARVRRQTPTFGSVERAGHESGLPVFIDPRIRA